MQLVSFASSFPYLRVKKVYGWPLIIIGFLLWGPVMLALGLKYAIKHAGKDGVSWFVFFGGLFETCALFSILQPHDVATWVYRWSLFVYLAPLGLAVLVFFAVMNEPEEPNPNTPKEVEHHPPN